MNLHHPVCPPTPPLRARDLHTDPRTARRWGYLLTSQGIIGVQVVCQPQPHVMFYPPICAVPGALADFLDTCRNHAEEDELWLHVSTNLDDGAVTLRIDLPNDDNDTIDAALEQARRFFERSMPVIARASLGSQLSDAADDPLF